MTDEKAGAYLKLRKLWYSPAEIADLTGVSRQTVCRWLDEGRLPYERTLGGHRRIPAEAIEGAGVVEQFERVPLVEAH